MTLKAGIFDLDGVITDTAKLHFVAWKQLFDEYLSLYGKEPGLHESGFTINDYKYYVDGKPRIEGVRSFLHSHSITLPLGREDDDENRQTMHGLAKKKQGYFLETLDRCGVPLFQDTIKFIKQLIKNNIITAVASSSKNCQMILRRAGIEDLFKTRVDGSHLNALGIRGKPCPDMFLHAAKIIGIKPKDVFIVEDAIVGVQAGRAGGFGLVIGIDREGSHKKLFQENGADLVIENMGDLSLVELMESA